jgi:NAD-dependent dihydropyrimidine dehydrogenase PreA subunit
MNVVTPEIDLDKCNGCGDCVEQCPSGIVALVDGKASIVRPEDCSYCTDCEDLCSSAAIRCPFEIVLLQTEPERPTSEEYTS